jgi:hypothetical protein
MYTVIKEDAYGHQSHEGDFLDLDEAQEYAHRLSQWIDEDEKIRVYSSDLMEYV